MLYIGCIGFLLYWTLLVHIFRKWGFDSFQTISDHIARGEQRRFYNLRAMILFSVFMLYVLISLLPSYKVGTAAYIFALVAWIGELLVIHFPRYGRHFVFHDRLTLLVGSSGGLLVAFVGFSSSASTSAHWITGLSLIISTIFCVPIISQKRRKNFLYFQSSFFGGLQITLLVLGFLVK